MPTMNAVAVSPTSGPVDPNEWYVLDDERMIHRSQLPLYDLAINKPNPTLTVVAVTDDYKVAAHVNAIRQTAVAVPFPVEQLLASMERPRDFLGRWVELPKRFGSMAAYSEFMIRRLPDLIDTDFCLTVQWDGYAIHPEAWSDEFLKYDYIGAPFARQPVLEYLFPRFRRRVGNGAFSLRSSRWLLLGKTATGFAGEAEDMFCCQKAVKHWLRQGCRIAPMDVAIRFSGEWRVPEYPDWNYEHSFGFHGFLPDGLKRSTEWPSYTKMVFQLGGGFLKRQIKMESNHPRWLL